jgi:hypothetical protein
MKRKITTTFLAENIKEILTLKFKWVKQVGVDCLK